MTRAVVTRRVGTWVTALAPWMAWEAGGEATRDLVLEEVLTESRAGVALWVLTVGVSQYKEPRISLQYADHDAERIAEIFQTQQGTLFREVFTRTLTNEGATREAILKAMGEFLGQAAPGDVVLVFVAGHGIQDRQTGTYYFVPYDANSENLVYAGLPMPMFEEVLKRLRSNVDKIVLWLDTCHAGAASLSARGIGMGEDLAEALDVASGQYVLSASKAGEASQERADYRFPGDSRAHGAFTYSLLRGLTEEATDSTGVVWLGDLFTHVGRQVPRLTGGRQHPHGRIEGTDMPIFVMREGLLAKASSPDVRAEDHSAAEATTPAPEAGVTEMTLAPPVQVRLDRPGDRRKWLWLLLGSAAIGGGAGAVLEVGPFSPSTRGTVSREGPTRADGDGTETGSLEIDIEVP